MKRSLALLIAVLLCLSCFPVAAMAAEAEPTEISLDAIAPESEEAAEPALAETVESDSAAPVSSDPQTASDADAGDGLLSASDSDSGVDDAIDASANADSTENTAESANGEAEAADETGEDAFVSEEGSDEAGAEDAALDCMDAPELDGATPAPDFSAVDNGWRLLNNTWYFVSNHAASTGWIKSGNSWYYLDPNNNGAMATGLIDIDGDGRYYLSSSGAMNTGWIYTKPEGEKSSAWYYFGSSGRGVEGWLKSGKSWYYLDPQKKGAMATGLIDIDGDGQYYLSSSGVMSTGWIRTTMPEEKTAAWYYFGSSGRKATGWLKTGSIWTTKYYYLDPEKNGAMVTGWNDIDNARYYMASNGSVTTGWLAEKDDWYYFDVLGKMITGWAFINSNDYYFYKDTDEGSTLGSMAKDTVIDDRAIDENGLSELPEMEEDLSYRDKIVIRAQYYSSDTSNLMILDRSVCKVYLFTGSTGNWTLNNVWSCSPGYRTTPTPSGTFVTQDQGYYFDSESARCFWWTQFYGSYCLHSTLYHQNGLSPTTASVMNATLGARISHGCVRLATATAKWVHDNINYGTRFIVY